jgi:hypothetical protein
VFGDACGTLFEKNCEQHNCEFAVAVVDTDAIAVWSERSPIETRSVYACTHPFVQHGIPGHSFCAMALEQAGSN